jgi:hypothetical protein
MENQFNLIEALMGKPVRTKCGKKVTQLTIFKTNDKGCLVGDVRGELRKFTIDGKSFASDCKYLVMANPTNNKKEL